MKQGFLPPQGGKALNILDSSLFFLPLEFPLLLEGVGRHLVHLDTEVMVSRCRETLPSPVGFPPGRFCHVSGFFLWVLGSLAAFLRSVLLRVKMKILIACLY